MNPLVDNICVSDLAHLNCIEIEVDLVQGQLRIMFTCISISNFMKTFQI
jgi:hypothetical protein